LQQERKVSKRKTGIGKPESEFMERIVMSKVLVTLLYRAKNILKLLPIELIHQDKRRKNRHLEEKRVKEEECKAHSKFIEEDDINRIYSIPIL